MSMLLGAAAALALVSGTSRWYTGRLAAKQQQRAGKYAGELAENRAIGLEQRANVEAAIGQRAAINQRRLGRYVRSSAIARAAASGVDPSSPQVTNILGDIDREAELRALTALYQGAEGQRIAHYGALVERRYAKNLRYQGKIARKLGEAQANVSLLRGGAEAAVLGYGAYKAETPATTGTTGGSALYRKYGRAPGHGYDWTLSGSGYT